MKTIKVKVMPKAKASKLEELSNGTWLARIKSPPLDGKANKELVSLIAKYFQLPKVQITIISGASGRIKLVRVDS